jgi:hypothetical protein
LSPAAAVPGFFGRAHSGASAAVAAAAATARRREDDENHPSLAALAAAVLLAAGFVSADNRAVIRFADLGGIEDWRADGDDAILIEGRNDRWYRAISSVPVSVCSTKRPSPSSRT